MKHKEEFASLRAELSLVLKKYRELQLSVLSQEEKIQQLLVEKQSLESELLQSREQVKTIKLAQAIKGTDDQSTHALKIQINRYLREIDQCLNLINKD